ncbi:MAG: peptidase S9, partial [Bacteroidales bacterium]|nr:peptidase S9 [Bacteroidales bacterium]
MKRITLIFSALVLLFTTACNQKQEASQNIIGKHMLTLESDIMTPEILWAFGRVGDVQVSPDNSKILYGVSYYSIEKDKSNRELFLMDIDGENKRQITNTAGGEYAAVWRPDGQRIGYMSAASGSMQLWEMDADGANPRQVSDVEDGISGFLYAPDLSKVLFTKEVKVYETVKDANPDLDKTSGRLMTDLMYRHWDSWVDSFSHVFIADYEKGSLGEPIDIMDGEPWDAPLKPFGGTEQITWSPDSKTIVYTSRKLEGMAYSVSTNSDLYSYNIETGQTSNLTEGMFGYDMNPSFSPDGILMAWESMERNGYESDKSRLYIMNMVNGEKTYYTKDFDQNANGLSWSADGKSIYFISDWH